MTPLHTIGCIALAFSAVCAFFAWRRGEWVSVKRANETLNQAFGDQPDLDGLGFHGEGQ